jgi:hypothetical protein
MDRLYNKFAGGSLERIVIAQILYATGAALCLISTYWSIAFIVLMQMHYAIAPEQFFVRKP